MKYKNNLIKILRVFKMTLKVVPVSGILSPLYYLIQGVFPAFIAYITVCFFDSAYSYSKNQDSISRLYVYAILFCVVYFMKEVLQVVASVTINAGVYEKCVNYQNIELANKASKLRLTDYENSKIMDCYRRAKQCVSDEKLSSIYMSLAVLLTNIIGCISVVLVLSSYSMYFVFISIFSVIPYLIVHLIRGQEFYRLKYYQAKRNRFKDYLWGVLTNRSSIKEMRVMGFGGYITGLWSQTKDEVNQEVFEFRKKDVISLFCCNLIRITGYAISLILSFILVKKGEISIGVFSACIIAFTNVQNQIMTFLSGLSGFHNNLAYADDFFEFLDLPEYKEGEQKYDGLKENISVKHVSFMYPGTEKECLKDISFDIQKGEHIAIVGENGSGKTTLAKLLLGLYEVNAGNVYYDGEDVSKFQRKEFLSKVSYVQQSDVAFKFSIRENVALAGEHTAQSDERIKEKLKSVGLNELTDLDQMLGREFNGIELSGGQNQKLAIARGEYKESELIVLDEPTSNADPVMESEILTRFIHAAQGKTTVIISHRIGICKLMDRIIVLKDGRIEEIGAHKELIARKGEYYKMFNSQKKWYKDIVE